MNFLFFDQNQVFLTALKKDYQKYRGAINVSIRISDQPIDVRDLEVDIYVSPANSFGWMDGGIDDVYRDMFPGVQEYVMNQIRQNSHLTTVYDRRVLPIGSALLIDLEQIPESARKMEPKYRNKKLICAPTMERPHNIEFSPENVYYAMYAILKLGKEIINNPANKLPLTVAIPGLGTGVGGLSSETSVNQIMRALVDFSQGRDPEYPEGTEIKTSQNCYLVSPVFLR